MVGRTGVVGGEVGGSRDAVRRRLVEGDRCGGKGGGKVGGEEAWWEGRLCGGGEQVWGEGRRHGGRGGGMVEWSGVELSGVGGVERGGVGWS